MKGGEMKKTRLIFLFCALTAAVWSFPGLAQAKGKSPASGSAQTASMFDGKIVSMFDGTTVSMFDG
jgi:uncharacterized membrane protein YtjA (UPF0391 family)